MTALLRRDPLLATARILIMVLIAALALAILACGIGLVAAIAERGTLLAYAEGETDPGTAMAAIIGLVVLIIALLALVIRFLQHLGRIVASVGEGDPFMPENASRLRHMAWLALGAQVLSWCIELVALWLDAHFPDVIEGKDITLQFGADGGVSLTGIALVLVLFILARVFRKGAEMRDDLEGTV